MAAKSMETYNLLCGPFDPEFHARAELTEWLRDASIVVDDERYASYMQAMREKTDKVEKEHQALDEQAGRLSDVAHRIKTASEDLKSVYKQDGHLSDDQVKAALVSLKEAELELSVVRARKEDKERQERQARLDKQETRLDEQQARLDERAARIRDQKAAIAADRLVLQENKQLAIDSAVWKGRHQSMRTMSQIPPRLFSDYGITPGFIDENGTCVPNAEHHYFEARKFVKWLVRSNLMTDPKSEWCGADAVGHRLGLHNPAGKEVNEVWGWFDGIRDELEGAPIPSLVGMKLPKLPK
jgi:hypothetical protein